MIGGAAAIGRRIREARKAAGLTQAGLAETVGLAPETVSRLEHGAFAPSVPTLIDIADALGVGLDALARGSPATGRRPAAGAPADRRLVVRISRLAPATRRIVADLVALLPAGRRPR
jgi:transcriptional regulator with XRE-family HTH domain